MRLRSATAAAALVVLAGPVLVGCGNESASSAGSPDAPGTTVPDSSSSAIPQPTPAPPSTAPASLASHLLASEQLPGSGWGAPTDPGTDAVGVCNRVSLTTIGAVTVDAVAFGHGPSTIVNQVGTLPDEMTGARLTQVLRSMRAQCQMSTTSITAAAVPAGTGWWYITETGKEHAEGFGVALNGRLISVISFSGKPSVVRNQIGDLVQHAAEKLA